jgi:tripartite-type tricarboxylate transporter receptor subunit TctC
MYSRRGSFRKMSITVTFLILGLFVGSGLSQESYPNRPVTVVAWAGAGGMMDVVARALCRVAEKELGQPIVVENRTGATGTIGINYVLKSKPDGYTLGVSATSAYIFSPHLRDTPYNVLTDSVDIIAYGKATHALCVKADAPWKTYEDIISYARKNPGKFTYSSSGVGSIHHITMERIAMKEGIKWTMVPFKGNMEAVAACLGGHIDAALGGPVDVNAFVKEGKLRMLLLLDDTRWPEFPDIPTVLEKGYDFFIASRYCIYGPSGIPDHVLQKLEAVFTKAAQDPSFIDIGRKFQMDTSYMSGKAYSQQWRSKYEESGKAIRALGLGKK